MSYTGVIIGGLVATFIVWVITRLMTMNIMGLERYFATMVTQEKSPAIGFIFLYVLGIILGFIYAGLWSAGIGWPSYLYGFIFGIVQWIVLGFLIDFLPSVHTGIRSGAIRAPGLFMMNLTGLWAIPAGLTSNVTFGLVFAYVYQFFASRYDWIT